MSQTLRWAAGDMYVGADGRGQLLQDVDKCAQDLAEQLISPFDPVTGQGNELIGDDLRNATLTSVFGDAFIQQRISDVVHRLQQLQNEDPNITAAEKISRILDIHVFTLQTDKRNVAFFLSVQVESGAVIKRTFTVDLSQLLPSDQGTIPVPVA